MRQNTKNQNGAKHKKSEWGKNTFNQNGAKTHLQIRMGQNTKSQNGAKHKFQCFIPFQVICPGHNWTWPVPIWPNNLLQLGLIFYLLHPLHQMPNPPPQIILLQMVPSHFPPISFFLFI
jgi:hypothetical protein